jgi:hypothetical protein
MRRIAWCLIKHNETFTLTYLIILLIINHRKLPICLTVSQILSKKFSMVNIQEPHTEVSSQPRYHSPLSNFRNMTYTRHTEAVKTQGWCARCFTERLTSPQGQWAANTEQASTVVKEAQLTRDAMRYNFRWSKPTIWGAKWASRCSQRKIIISVSMSFIVPVFVWMA